MWRDKVRSRIGIRDRLRTPREIAESSLGSRLSWIDGQRNSCTVDPQSTAYSNTNPKSWMLTTLTSMRSWSAQRRTSRIQLSSPAVYKCLDCLTAQSMQLMRDWRRNEPISSHYNRPRTMLWIEVAPSIRISYNSSHTYNRLNLRILDSSQLLKWTEICFPLSFRLIRI